MIEDYNYIFTAPNGVPSKCRIRTYTCVDLFHKGDLLIICSQLVDDEASGMSITNAAEHIATGVMNRHQVQPMKMIWIEHYPARGWHQFGSDAKPDIEETLDRVLFDVVIGGYFVDAIRQRHDVAIALRRPHWTHRIPREMIEAMIGENF